MNSIFREGTQIVMDELGVEDISDLNEDDVIYVSRISLNSLYFNLQSGNLNLSKDYETSERIEKMYIIRSALSNIVNEENQVKRTIMITKMNVKDTLKCFKGTNEKFFCLSNPDKLKKSKQL